LWTDVANSARRQNYGMSAGRRSAFSVLHWYDMTLSVGYAVGFREASAPERMDDLAQDHVDVMIRSLSPAIVGLLPVATSSRRCSTSTATSSCACAPCWRCGAGALVAVACYFANAAILNLIHLEFTTYSRYVAPVVEELLKALVIVWLIHANRIGFLVDAAIFGFAVGTGFALVENVYFLEIAKDAGIGHVDRPRLRHGHHARRRHRVSSQ
jgi:hypothetical protein